MILLRSAEPILNYLCGSDQSQLDLHFFTSSASTYHICGSLQALPFLPSDDRLGTLRAKCNNLDVISVSLITNGKGRKKEKEKGETPSFLYEMWSKFWVASTETSLPFMSTMYLCALLWTSIIHFRVDELV